MKIPFRGQIGRGLKALLYALYGRAPGHGVRVLEYHYVDETGSPLSISPAGFRAHLEVLRAGGWTALTRDEFIARLPRPCGAAPAISRAGAREVFLTFDDGQETFATTAAPLLREFGLPATLFVVTDLIGQSAQWFERDSERIGRFLSAFAFSASERAALERHWQAFAGARLIDWDGLRRLKLQGINIENHSASHQFLTQLSDDEIKWDLQRSKESLHRELGIESRLFCYPYGDSDDRVARAVRDAGFRAGFVSAFTPGINDPMRIGRLPLGGAGGTFQFRFALSRAMDVLTGLRR